MAVHEDEIRLYKENKARRLFYGRLWIILSASILVLILFLSLFVFYFVVRDITVEGSERYTKEELLAAADISIKDNLFMISENEVESRLKEAFPYIQSVQVKKDYPDAVTLVVTEEYTVFSYEMLGEFFLFNPELRLMGKFDTFEELLTIRTPIVVEMPIPKSCIVPQYIQLQESCSYIPEFIRLLSNSALVQEITKIDLRDRFVIKMEFGSDLTVEFGDCLMAEEKLISLYKLIGNQIELLTGHIDLSDYPNCFHSLTQKKNG